MNTMELFLWKLPRLRHFVFSGKVHIDIANGRRWEILAIDLVTFHFNFQLGVGRLNNILETFRTPFWLERKRWFVAYKNHHLFSVPYFADTIASFPFYPPVHSTAPDDRFFFQHIKHLQLPEVATIDLHYFTHIETLELRCTIPLTTLHTMIDLSRVRHLILDRLINLSNLPILSNIMPNLHKLSLNDQWKNILRSVREMQPIEQIRSLQLDLCEITHVSDITQFCRIFPCVEHLHVNYIDSINYVGSFIDGFKLLSSASFHLPLVGSNRIRFLRRPNMIVVGSRWLANNTFVCRTICFNQYLVHVSVWIGEQVNLSRS
ncbi:unnamed protein product [Rotaria sordida]|uniref:Uncharacterized protein n=2 Tax=Rotaria sordida TaxID=392033 RepID=A0A819SNC5_9BILA|nr:unnamed protein product [Rotaria sordida]